MPKSDTQKHYRRATLVTGGLITVVALMQLLIAAYVIPRFSEIYRDMLGNRPLPSLTEIMLHSRWVLFGLAFVWPITASYLVQHRAPLSYLLVILALLLVTITFALVPLFLPLIGEISGRPQ